MTDILRSRPLVTLSQAQVDVLIRKHEKLNSGVLGGARADFSFHDLSGLNLVNSNLSDTDFTGARLFKCDLSGSRLERASLFAADLRNADLGGAVLRRADMRGICARGANFSRADLSQTDLREGAIAERQKIGVFNYLSHAGNAPRAVQATDSAVIVSENSPRTGFVLPQADFSDANMTRCNLTRANMKNARLDHAILQGADLSGADFTGASLDGAILCGAIMNLTTVSKAALALALTDAPAGKRVQELEHPLDEILHSHALWVASGGKTGRHADLSGVDLRNTDVLEASELTALKAENTVFYGLSLRGTALQGALLMGADLRGVDLREADLRGANLTGARLNHANLRGSNLGPLQVSGGRQICTRLTGACIRYANLSNAQITGAIFGGADMTGAVGLDAP
ncbi:MAG: pentapeptide repeat-containing protein [Alphaproteobacteria bacterium]